MKNFIAIFMISIAGMFCLTGCDQSETSNATKGQKITGTTSRVLIVYFSRTGNTRQIANWIQEAVNGDLVELKLATPYPAEYQDVLKQVRKEIDESLKPPLSTKIKNMADYDIIFVGTPNWWGSMAPPVATFLTSYDFNGKTIVPFVTHGGAGESDCVSGMKRFAAGAAFREPLVVSSSRIATSQEETATWAKNNISAK